MCSALWNSTRSKGLHDPACLGLGGEVARAASEAPTLSPLFWSFLGVYGGPEPSALGLGVYGGLEPPALSLGAEEGVPFALDSALPQLSPGTGVPCLSFAHLRPLLCCLECSYPTQLPHLTSSQSQPLPRRWGPRPRP